MPTASRLKVRFDGELVPVMMERFGYRNRMAVPRLSSITLNMGVGDAIANIKVLDNAAEQLTLIAGQKAAVTRAKTTTPRSGSWSVMIQTVSGRPSSVVRNTHPGSARPDADQMTSQRSAQPSSHSPSPTGQMRGKTVSGGASMCWT